MGDQADEARNQAMLVEFLNVVQDRLDQVSRSNDAAFDQLAAVDLQLGDLRAIAARNFGPFAAVEVRAARPVATTSRDHLYPTGTIQDNTRHPRFFQACERHFGRRLRYLDLGCSGGGLVFDARLRGHLGIGIEGSDASFQAQRAEWRTIPEALFTGDITQPFGVFDKATGVALDFDVISAWEVLEHLEEGDLPQLFANVLAHLAPSGLFVGSVSMVPEILSNGVDLHRTIRPREWWQAVFGASGFTAAPVPVFAFGDFPRGIGKGRLDPDYGRTPDNGFHFVMMRV
ncbi:MAG: methyltransferase domain-containing protein [Azospirillaceae bacterium]|nr:methyltransferase domain-containing protein [Azospirillaceae bacterium]